MTWKLPYLDRREAGRRLAELCIDYRERDDVVVLALPRGGVPVAHEVALSLGAPLDILIVRKLGVPGHEELAMGAIASGGAMVFDQRLASDIGLPQTAVDQVIEREWHELSRRERAYRNGAPPFAVAGRCVILVDDGLATGSTMLAAVRALRELRPARIVVAVPIAPPQTCDIFRAEVDEILCGATPRVFRSVGAWYLDFQQTSDDEVRRLLADAWARTGEPPAGERREPPIPLPEDQPWSPSTPEPQR